MHLGFIGFGLIGGSIARAVRANPATADWTMAAWSPQARGRVGRRRGRRRSSVATPEAVLDGADLVIWRLTTACLALIDRLAGPWRGLCRRMPW
jgi:3-hydroxyisobutyrate dehydrogenase-like beta-hydroxyacid dehydrogenase